MIKPTLYEWTALSQRLDGFLATHDRFAKLPSDAVNGAQQRAMLETAISLAKDMLSFRDAAQTSTPGASLPSGNDKRIQDIIKGGLESGNLRSAFVAELTILLSLMRNGLDAYFNDGQEVLRLRAERAFRHLQWSIASTRYVRSSWIRAFQDDEPACEALGATHLLLHGIFAYKATSPNARTDLVFHDPVDADQATKVADGLVLTEWKRVRKEADLDKVIAGAQTQADLYVGGVLEGTELRRVRYVVVVTEQQMKMPPDASRGDYILRHVNIAVKPASPSVAAPKLTS